MLFFPSLLSLIKKMWYKCLKSHVGFLWLKFIVIYMYIYEGIVCTWIFDQLRCCCCLMIFLLFTFVLLFDNWSIGKYIHTCMHVYYSFVKLLSSLHLYVYEKREKKRLRTNDDDGVNIKQGYRLFPFYFMH
jgi:hypothetical protein